jgi:hypothetical protein
MKLNASWDERTKRGADELGTYGVDEKSRPTWMMLDCEHEAHVLRTDADSALRFVYICLEDLPCSVFLYEGRKARPVGGSGRQR